MTMSTSFSTSSESAVTNSSRWPRRHEIEPGPAKKHLRPVALEPLEAFIETLESAADWTLESIEKAFEQTCKAQGDLKLGKLAQPVRVAVTGTGASPGIYETLEVVGRERAIARLKVAAEFIRERARESG